MPALLLADEADRGVMAPADTTELRKHCERRMQALLDVRDPWLQFCRAIADELIPNRLPYLDDPFGDHKAGEQNTHIVDAVGYQSLLTAAAGLASGAFPANVPWYDLAIRGVFGDDPDILGPLQEAELALRTTHNQSNANQALNHFAVELLAFGTAAAMFVEDDLDVFRIDTLSVGEYCIAEDHRDRVDTLYRRLTMTVGQLADEFGEDKLSDSSRLAWDRGEYDTVVQCVHAIEPDRDRLNPIRSEALPWRSVYYELSAGCTEVLGVRGYEKFPVLVSRWSKLPGTAYGHGRGMDALPHLVRLRKQIYRYGQAMALQADPPLQLPPGLAGHEVRRLPGGVTTVAGNQPIRPLFEHHHLRLAELHTDIEKTRQDVRDSLGATLVASLRTITHQMTAREVDTRTSQDLMEFLPAIYRLHDELLEPLIEREWDACDAAGLLPAIPERAGTIDIEFNSPLARRQRQPEVDAIVRVFAIAGEISKVRRDVLDNLNVDAAIRKVAAIEGAPVEVLVHIRQMQQERKAQAQAQMAETQAAAAQQGAEIAKGFGEAAQATRNVA